MNRTKNIVRRLLLCFQKVTLIIHRALFDLRHPGLHERAKNMKIVEGVDYEWID